MVEKIKTVLEIYTLSFLFNACNEMASTFRQCIFESFCFGNKMQAKSSMYALKNMKKDVRFRWNDTSGGLTSRFFSGKL